MSKKSTGKTREKSNSNRNQAEHLTARMKTNLNGRTITERIGILYVVCMLLVFPLFFHDYFFDITKTKYLFFAVVTLVGFSLAALSLLVQDDMLSQLRVLKPSGAADYWMLAWVAVSIVSCIASVDRAASVSGADARWQGLLAVFLYALAYYIMSRCVEIEKIFCYIFLAPGCLNALLGVLNHFGVDPLGFYERMKEAQIPKFMGTIGNINMFAGYMCLVFAGVFVLFLFEKKRSKQILWGVLLLATLGHLAGNSDLSYAGLGVTVLVLFAVSWKKKTSMPRLFYGGAVVFAGYCLFYILQDKFAANAVSMEGISKELLAHGGLLPVGAAVCVAVGVLYRLILARRERENSDSDQKKCAADICFHVLSVCILLLAAVFLIVASRMEEIAAFFTFNDTWGDYRGFVWTRLWQLFCDFSPVRMLIGSGPGTVKTLLNDYCYDEMKELTGVVYDAAHNEYLQYLVTTGIAGLVTYAGFLGSVFLRGFRALGRALSEEKKICLMFGLAIVAAYAGQAAFSLAQPITTPFLFVFLGWIEKAGKEET
ncbi:MAG: O-antigen ligase family protein [Lachnospiraceae bacterium]|nr:O-antigen ligase family protein [Lachnospiraceae bacterium]